MNPIFTSVHHAPLPPLPTRLLHPKPPLLPSHSLSFSLPFSNTTPRPITARIPSHNADIEMVLSHDFSWSARDHLVVVLWDLDNKPPRSQPYDAVIALRRVAGLFGRVVQISAYANRHAFLHIPQWVIQSRRERRDLDVRERKGLVVPDKPYICAVCGRKCGTNYDLRRHFVNIHERERQKKLSRLRSLKGKKRREYKTRFVSGNSKYTEAAREILIPKKGYGLDSELRRAGVFVKMVEDKPQAADSAVKRQMEHSVSRGIDCLFLVSDDSDFSDMIRKAREAGLRTVVVGDGRRALGRFADFWIPWMRVQKGEVGEEVLLSGRNSEFHGEGDGEDEEDGSFYSSAVFYDDDDDDDDDDDVLDQLVDEIVVDSSGFDVSAFSEEDMWDGMNVKQGSRNGVSGVLGATVADTSLSYDIEDENDCYI